VQAGLSDSEENIGRRRRKKRRKLRASSVYHQDLLPFSFLGGRE
jgi:hypothetical protein